MDKQRFAALAAIPLTAPACVLVAAGLLGRVPPPGLTHPALVLGGLALAVTWSLAMVLRLHLGRTREALVFSVHIETHGRAMNFAALTMGSLLLLVIAAYLFVENLGQLAIL